jgi:hypothetical protein
MTRRKLIELDDTYGRSVTTEEFLLHLHRSSELLRTERTEDARNAIEMAFDAQPKDPNGQASMALVYFKLGLYPRAIAIYEKLVAALPDDPVIRLNLALVYFKTGQTRRARDELERVVQIQPDYRKAYGYLGLACQRLGDFERAHEAFGKAGAAHLADRMARFVEPDKHPLPAGLEEVPPSESPERTPVEIRSDDDTPEQPDEPTSEPTEMLFGAQAPLDLAPLTSGLSEPLPVSELTGSTRLLEPLTGRFLVSDSGFLLINVNERVHTRLDGLHFCSSDGLSYQPLVRRKRGLPSREHFGGADEPVFEVEGAGRLGYHPRDGVFSAVSLDDEIAYVREQMVFAFDPDLTYENGRLPGSATPLVHFRGRGAIVLHTPVPPHSLEVTPDRGVVIPSQGLVGWFGRMLPRKAAPGPFDPDLDPLQLVGEGVLLFCLI